MNTNNRMRATVAMLLTITFWGISASSNKIALREVPPSTLALIRFTIASMVLWIIKQKMNPDMKAKQQDRLPLILGGLIGVTFYFLFENYGLSYINASNATIILASIPVFTLIIEAVYYKQPIGLQKGSGAALSILGVIMVIGNSFSINTTIQEVLGSLLMIGAALCWVIYSMINKGLEGKYPTMFLTFQQSRYGALFLLPFALLERGRWQPIGMLSWVNILYLALICSALCYFLYLYALKHLGPSQTNVYINLMPFIGVFAANAMLGERLYPLQMLGGGIIIAGIYVVNYRSKKGTESVVEGEKITA